jgi:two-component system, chemotaxis family, protein-glutamate methylesterase/glutaminase
MSMAHGEPGTGNRDVIVIAGPMWTEAVTRLACRLPADLLAAVLVAIHRGLDGAGLLGGVLAAAGPLPAAMAEEGQPLERSRIYGSLPGGVAS